MRCKNTCSTDYTALPSPCYVLEEEKLRRNIAIIAEAGRAAEVEIILALKAYALWRTFPIFRENGIGSCTASSLNEARLAFEEMGAPAHTYNPAYADKDFPQLLSVSSHLTFNSLSQINHFLTPAGEPRSGGGENVTFGLRINPEFSPVETSIYNPCAPGSRFGVPAKDLGKGLPPGIEGIHFHTLCEGNSYDLADTLAVIEEKFPSQLAAAKWINMGGGHLITHADYDRAHLTETLQAFRMRYPHLHVILEPGSAFGWQAGFLRATVLDVVRRNNIDTIVVDTSFTCHMPDTLEMPYQPRVRNASNKPEPGQIRYRIGGAGCLSGDFISEWGFGKEVHAGDELIFEDMLHYTTVKTTMFNGITHPAIALLHADGSFRILRNFEYEDYKNRMD